MSLNESKETYFSHARSLNNGGYFFLASTITVFFYVAVMVSLYYFIHVFMCHSMQNVMIASTFPIISIASFCCSLLSRRNAKCPLCRGTPLLNSRASSHKKAYSFGPFNEGHTAVLSIICTRKMRCMYCGTKYDLLKKSHFQRTSK
jgi:hypothetical protein